MGILNQQHEDQNRIGKFCNLRMVEDEFHFLLKCPLYSDIRHNFIDNVQRNCDNVHPLSEKKYFLWILRNEDNNMLLKLCDFLLKGFNLRTVTNMKIIHTSTFTIIHTNFNHYLETTQRKQRHREPVQESRIYIFQFWAHEGHTKINI
jgi:hypothetical protein